MNDRGANDPSGKDCIRKAKELEAMGQTMQSGEARKRALLMAKFWERKARELEARDRGKT
jgi:hypothetical protein